MITLGKNARAVYGDVSALKTAQKNKALLKIAENLRKNSKIIIEENKKDIVNAKANNMTEAFIDRLTLTDTRIEEIAKAAEKISELDDPIGKILGGGVLPDGFRIEKIMVPLGVIGIIFESRPNVTVDAACLCLKSGNTCILRGGSDAINSNKILTRLMRDALTQENIPADAIQLVEDTSREKAAEMMKLNGYIDVLIPRGGKGLIRSVVENATVPVIETGEGNCHIFIDESADIDMALKVTDNAKTQRPSVCNAIETILVHKNIAEEFLPKLSAMFKDRVELRGCNDTVELIGCKTASDEDYYTEYNDYIAAVKVIDNVTDAVKHINKYGTGHSEAIITRSIDSAEAFRQGVDAAAVYVNASTRFTDGGIFGLGAEIGISTQKLHVRGPMGLDALTTVKYLIQGEGNIR